MRGKKTDPQFLSEFIERCVVSGFESSESIVGYARTLIAGIDEEIQEVERKKVIRSKLLDVVSAFEKGDKSPKTEEIKLLSFFKIQNQQICKFICDHLKNGASTVEELSGLEFAAPDVLFCLKQLLEHKVISKSGNHLLRGEMFDEYLKFVLRDT